MSEVRGPERVYHQRSSLQIFAAVFLAGSLVCSIGVWIRESHSREPSYFQLLGTALFMLASTWFATQSFLSTVKLSREAIEVRTLFTRGKLALSTICGRRERVVEDPEGGRTKFLKIVPWSSNLPTLEFPEHFDFDTDFYLWYDELEDLDTTSPD